MHSYDSVLCIIYVLLIVIGIFGNGLLLYSSGCNIITDQRMRPIELLFINLAFSNIMLILLRGIPWSVQFCIQKFFLGDSDCKIIIYLQRVFRGISLCTTSLLSVFQAITISSHNPICTELKARFPKNIVSFSVCIFVLNLLIDGIVPLYVTGTKYNTKSNLSVDIGYCSIDRYALTTSKFIILKSLYDAVFMGFMIIASGYMVLVLYRHHWQVQHIHNANYNSSISPETRATKVILLLMSLFICFYSLSSIFIIVMDNSRDTNLWLIYSSVVFSLCYPTISPYLLISNDSQIPNCYYAFKMIRKSNQSLRKKAKQIKNMS
ncbi:vomeronasal type-1 receptor 4-like [Antechinus flavipes]|uniref:vomeronasal type-1 receptor 4-like n=1 Tax=Antechinus flavipes TaxID=38775 RepID=UPI0022364962|nr:vomeronasal type-1 receptor 4-like [Antechinus flavipes]